MEKDYEAPAVETVDTQDYPSVTVAGNVSDAST